MATLKRSNTNEFKATVFSYLVDSINADGQNRTESEAVQYLRDRFICEYCHEYNLQRYPNHQDRLANWFAGLPIGIDYTNHDILTVAAKWHKCNVDAFTYKQRKAIIDDWFNFLALFAMRMIHKHGFDVTS